MNRKTGTQPMLTAWQVPSDLAVWLFGSWTLICHGTVFSGGRPAALYTGFVVWAVGWLLAAGLLGPRRLLAMLSDHEPGGRSGDATVLGATTQGARMGAPGPPGPKGASVLGRSGLRAESLVRWVWGLLAALVVARSGSGAGWAETFVATAGLLCTGCVCVWVYGRRPPRVGELPQAGWTWPRAANPQASTRRPWAPLLVLGLCTAAYTGFVSRPDPDEAFYWAMASSLRRFPDLPILGFDPLHGDPSIPLQMLAYRAHSLELLSAVLAYWTGIEPTRWMHVCFPALFSLLLPLAVMRLCCLLAPGKALWATALVLVWLVIDGSVHKTFGNFAMVRFFQGKAAFVSVMVPLLYAYGLRFGSRPSARRFGLLAMGQVAAVGLTSTAIPLSPAIVALAVTAGVLGQRLGRVVTALGLGALSTGYVVAVAATLYMAMLGEAAPEKLAAAVSAIPEQGSALQPGIDGLWPVLSGVLGPDRTWLWSLGALLALPAVGSRLGARLALTVGIAFWLVGLNPLLRPFIEGHVLGPGTYWRVIWIVPFPVFVSLAWVQMWSSLAQRLRVGGWHRPLGGCCFVVVAWLVSSVPTFEQANRVSRPHRGLKVDPRYELARAAASALPSRGGVVAMAASGGVYLSSLQPRAFPVFVKRSYLRAKHRAARERLHHCLWRPSGRGCGGPALREWLDRLSVEVVVLRGSRRRAHPLATPLVDAGFGRERWVLGHSIWTRASDAPVGTDNPRADGT